MEGEGIEQGEKFSFEVLPTSSLAYAPLTLTALTLVGLLAAFVVGLRLTRNRRRTYLYLELVLIPIALAVRSSVILWPSSALPWALWHSFGSSPPWPVLAWSVHPGDRDTTVSSDSLSCLSNPERRHNGRSPPSIQLCWVRTCHQTGRMIRGSTLSGWPPFELLLDSHLGRNNPQIHRFHPPPQRLAGFAGGCQRGHLSDCLKG